MNLTSIFAENPGRLTIAILLVLTCVACPGAGAGFQVADITYGAPDFVPPADVTFKVALDITLNRSVMQSTLSAPGTVRVDIKGLRDGRTVTNVPGTFQFSGPPDTVAEVAFISDQTLADLINPGAGENLEYTITIVGSDAGAGVVTDSNGEALDGDMDGTPGGNFVKVLEVVG